MSMLILAAVLEIAEIEHINQFGWIVSRKFWEWN
jgi:hypothetical protein